MRIKYSTIELKELDIHLRTLRDVQQFDDKDDHAKMLGISPATWPLFGVLWPSGEVLARLVQKLDVQNLKILEVGCGIGLPSLVLNSMNADISATDHHPMASHFLKENAELNQGRSIPFFRSDWKDTDSESDLGKFDLIIGSDLLYQPDNVEQLAAFLNRHAKEKSEIILVDPGRGNLSKFKQAMSEFGFSNEQSEFSDSETIGWTSKGRIIHFSRSA